MENFLEIIKYILLGLFQGFTEPIPVSSSGHLVIVQHLFDLNIEGFTFELLVNAGSLIAVLIIYRQDLTRLTVNGLSYITTREEQSKSDFLFIVYLILATIPAGLVGVLFDDQIEAIFKENIYTIAITLIITGFALFLIRNLKGKKLDKDLSFKDAIIVGCAQAVALIPGISRSGATIVASMALGMKRETAFRFSFLLFIPVSVGGMMLGLSDLINDPYLSEKWIPYFLAFLSSIFASYYSLRWFMGIMERGNLKYFSYYCWFVGVLILLFL
ncbi:undecaprenyl-diphosphate phosphatase [Bacillus carboniphilus]|uniref:Undecaprenyl-diphosphatase n=1 Tax=Bacillus carboniphilus TaxID=86663 RepID=A0ABY9JX92_9BACI|nr:undecaprenyl-diphosphate phosphatase [Bacillus carboniphilus]WLR42933.1 undecaprenyl-diphosphate phosphatase [Bacillus carboniphilus]